MSELLYLRRCRLTVGPVTIEYADGEGLRMAFHVKKNPFASEPNHSTIQIFNLNRASRDAIFSLERTGSFVGPIPPTPITLEAGYSGLAGQPASMGAIFIGHLFSATHTKHGPDWVTEIIATDGLLSNEVRISKSIVGPISLGQIVAQFVTDLKGKIGNIDVEAVKARALQGDLNGVTEQLFRPLVIAGKLVPTLDRYLRPKGFELSEQDGELILLRADETRLGPPILLSADTGLIGRIDPVRDAKLPGAYVIKGRSLLRHAIKIGTRLELDRSVEPSGGFKVRKLDHVGDTHADGSHFFTEFEATSVPAVPPISIPDIVPWGSLA